MPPDKKQLIVATENVIIFDWDDTLLASSFLSAKGYRLDSADRHHEVDAQLKELEQSVVSVLSLAMSYGPTHIITNAESGWVQLSAQKFIPSVVPLLSKVTVHSARSTYESMFPENPLKWKYYAFQEKLASTFAEAKSEKHVVSFGDSHVEREAVRAVTKGLLNTRTKSVKFAERPSMEQLRRQLDLVTNCFHYILSHDGDLDLQLTVTVNAPNTTQQAATAATPAAATATGAAPTVPVAAATATAASQQATQSQQQQQQHQQQTQKEQQQKQKQNVQQKEQPNQPKMVDEKKDSKSSSTTASSAVASSQSHATHVTTTKRCEAQSSNNIYKQQQQHFIPAPVGSQRVSSKA
jgi:outer membrane biosynthesis protein TonB